ncbi:MAG TPA: glycosyltransferase, partial [Solirubrobacteraceae bacterium]
MILFLHNRYRTTGGEERAVEDLMWLVREHLGEDAELLVVDDGPDAATRATAERHGARYVAHDASRGLNAARNTGIDAARADLLVFVDDDVAVVGPVVLARDRRPLAPAGAQAMVLEARVDRAGEDADVGLGAAVGVEQR